VADTLHADKGDTAGAYDGEVIWRAGLWLEGPDLSPLFCDRGCIFLRLAWRASAGHRELPEIPDPAVSPFAYSFFSMMVPPGFHFCKSHVFFRLAGPYTGLAVLKDYPGRYIRFYYAVENPEIPGNKMGIY
jgi:hypothetical protein